MHGARWWPAFAIVLCSAWWGASSPSTSSSASAAAPQEPAGVAARTTHSVPFQHAGGVSGAVMVIRAEVNGLDTRLLFDTGAAFPLVIDAEVAQQRGLTGYYGVPVHGVGQSRIHMTAVESLAIGRWKTGALTAGIMDISHIRKAMGMLGTRIDGIVGMPVISGFRTVRLDFPRRRFELQEFAAGDPLPEALVAIRAEFGRDLRAITAIRAKKAGGLGIDVAVAGDALRITAVRAGSAAATAGLQTGDRITAIDDRPLGESPRDLRIREALAGAGAEVTLQFVRDGESRTVTVTLGAWKSGAPRAADAPAEDF